MTLLDETTPSINPGDDFYNFVNKKWRDSHPVPSDKSRYGVFTELDDTVNEQLHELLETPASDSKAQNIHLARAFYASAMDISAIEQRGVAPLQPFLDSIDSISDSNGVVAYINDMHAKGFDMVWSTDLDVDEKDSQRYVMLVEQDGLALPDRDYYTEDDEQFVKVRDEYKKFLANVFEMLGMDNPQARVNNVFAIEHKLAQASWTAIQNRDSEKKYNPYSFEQLTTEISEFDWQNYQKVTGLDALDRLVVSQPDFMRTATSLLQSESPDAWKDYLIIHTTLPLMSLLSKPFVDLHFAFYGKTLSGTEQQEDRYKRAIRHTAAKLPEPIGQLYIEKHFDESAKAQITDLVGHIHDALRARITNLDWMSDTTKQKAFEKLDTFMPLLGYPDTWRSYDGLVLGDDYVQNSLTIKQFDWRYNVSRATGPVNRKEWLMSPATVNAYYWPNTNGITFPAAILQPPFFDASGDFAANYGGIGEVIGHELSHGFDDQGALYDKIGNLNSWWTDDDRTAFDARAKSLVEQFDSYKVDGKSVKGELTLGENIADLGGLLIAYDALQSKLAESNDHELIDGFTPEQRFFMSQARCWRTNIRPELALKFLVTDPHSPAHLRVNGVVTNIDGWYDAWDIKESDELYKSPENRVRIW